MIWFLVSFLFQQRKFLILLSSNSIHIRRRWKKWWTPKFFLYHLPSMTLRICGKKRAIHLFFWCFCFYLWSKHVHTSLTAAFCKSFSCSIQIDSFWESFVVDNCLSRFSSWFFLRHYFLLTISMLILLCK